MANTVLLRLPRQLILGISGFVHSPVDRIDSSHYHIVIEIHLLGTEYLEDSGENHSSTTDIRSDIGEDLLGYRIPILGWAFLAFPSSIERVTVEWLNGHTVDSVE